MLSRGEARRGWKEADGKRKGAIPLCEGGGGYLPITTVRDQKGINFYTLPISSSSRQGLGDGGGGVLTLST